MSGADDASVSASPYRGVLWTHLRRGFPAGAAQASRDAPTPCVDAERFPRLRARGAVVEPLPARRAPALTDLARLVLRLALAARTSGGRHLLTSPQRRRWFSPKHAISSHSRMSQCSATASGFQPQPLRRLNARRSRASHQRSSCSAASTGTRIDAQVRAQPGCMPSSRATEAQKQRSTSMIISPSSVRHRPPSAR